SATRSVLAFPTRRSSDLVEVLVTQDRKLRQQRVAVMPMRVDGIATVGELRPHAVGEELVLWRLRPVVHPRGVARVGAQHFLEERSEEHTSELQSRENLVC